MQGWADLVVVARQRQLPVARHAECQPDGGGLNRQAADVDRRQHDEQVDIRHPPGQDGVQDVGGRRDRRRHGARSGDELLHVRNGDDQRKEEDRADDESADDRPQHRFRRLHSRILRFLGQGAGRIEAIDDEERHEHRGEEDPDLVI